MTIKQVEIDLIYRLSVEDAMKVLPPLLDEQVLKNIESFRAVAALGERDAPEIGSPINLARRLRVTTCDLPDKDTDAAVKGILAATNKLALGDVHVARLFPLEFQKPPRVVSEG